MTPTFEDTARRKRTDPRSVIRALAEYCATLSPGDRMPTLPQLMERFDASERAILTGLEELRRAGKIVRRNGIGTFVTGPDQAQAELHQAPGGHRAVNTIVAVTRRDHSFFDRCLSLLTHEAEDAGLTLICRSLNNWADINLEDLPAGANLAYLFLNHQFAPVARQLVARGRRAAVIGMPLGHEPIGCPNVYGDRPQGDRMILRHLYNLGHRRLAFYPWEGQDKVMAAARAVGPDCTGEIISPEMTLRWKAHPQEALEFFRRPQAPTAVWAWNDRFAIEVLGLLTRAGLRVPDDISLSGYDNLPEGALLHPGLTTVDGDITQQIEAALEILTAVTPAPNNRSVVIAPAMVIRESAGPPPG